MSKKGVAKPDAYVPQSASEQHFINDMLAASKQYAKDEPWTDFEFKELLQAWPEPIAVVANKVGVPIEVLVAFLDGNTRALRDEQILALRKLLSIHRDRFGGDYSQPVGPYILAPRSIAAAREAYDAATGGGDVQLCCEFAPRSKKHLDQLLKIRAPHIIGFTRLASDISFVLVPRESKTLPEEWREAFLNLADDPVLLDDEDFTRFLNSALVAFKAPEARSWILQLHSELYGALLQRLGREQRGY